MKAAIIPVGREILTGKTLDTNSHWLAGELTALGISVRRICVVDDVLEEIAGEISHTLSLGVDLVITTGGLGPTRDDMTLKAWARALGKDLEIHPRALEMVREKYQVLHKRGYVSTPELTPEREKMACMPRGAEPLFNPVGAAPGMLLEEGGKILVALPGVPGEMKAIFLEDVVPLLSRVLEKRGEGGVLLQEVVKSGFSDESLLWPLVRQVMDEMEGVYIKTLATKFGPDVDLEVRVEAWGKDEAQARERLERAVKRLKEILKGTGHAGD